MNKWWILPSSSNLSLHYSLVFKTSFKLIRYKSRFRTMGSKAVANFILWQKKSLLFWCFIFHTYIRQILMVFLWKSHLLPTVLQTHSDIFQESDLIARLYSPMSRLLSFIHVVGWKITQRQIFAPKPMDFERRELGTTSHKFQISCRKLSHLSSLMKKGIVYIETIDYSNYLQQEGAWIPKLFCLTKFHCLFHFCYYIPENTSPFNVSLVKEVMP